MRRPDLPAHGAGLLGLHAPPWGKTPPDGWGVHVVLDMETELGTDPSTSSHGEQKIGRAHV